MTEERRARSRTDAGSESGRLAVVVLNFGEPVEASEPVVVDYLERIFVQNRALEPATRAVRSGGAATGDRGANDHATAANDHGGDHGSTANDHGSTANDHGRAANDGGATNSAPNGATDPTAERARQLARARAPGLLDVYRRMGPSPLNAQADAQTRALEEALRARGRDAHAYSAFQFTAPSIEEQVRKAHAEGADTLLALPLYPLCGRSTSVAALESVEEALERMGWRPPLVAVAGWHHRPAYVAIRVDGVRRFLEDEGLDLRNADTLLYFSVHGTPVKYLDEGNRYDRYVEEHCRAVAHGLGVDRYAVGFQNHTNRRIEWTEPDNEDRVREAAERRLVVVPISFMHEQSETLAELDVDLRAFAEELGKELHRVPVPHDDPRFPSLLADLVEDALAAERGAAAAGGTATAGVSSGGEAPETATAREVDGALAPCRCRPSPGTWCTNGARVLPPSPYAGAARE